MIYKMEPALFNIFCFMEDPRNLSRVCRSWYESLRSEQEDSVDGILGSVHIPIESAPISPIFEKIKLLIQSNHVGKVRILVQCGFIHVQWRWFLLFIPSIEMANALRPVIGSVHIGIITAIIQGVSYPYTSGPLWLRHIANTRSPWSKLALLMYKNDHVGVDIMISHNAVIPNYLRQNVIELCRLQGNTMQEVFLIHYLASSVCNNDIRDVFLRHDIHIRPLSPSTDYLPNKGEYPRILKSFTFEDLIDHDRADLLALGYGMTDEESILGDVGMHMFIERIKKRIHRPFTPCMSENVMSPYHYIHSWIRCVR